MDRRQFGLASGISVATLLMLAHMQARALSLGDLSNNEASQGLKAALEKAALAAVSLLSRPDGFLGNEKVRIPLPGFLQNVATLFKTLGQGKRVDELVIAMNRAAEAAVPLAKDLLVSAVKAMTVTDAKKILAGGDTSATAFFAEKTREPLGVRFLPVVTQAIEQVGLAAQYNSLASKAAGMGLMKKEDASIQQYVTAKSLDGLFYIIGDEEKKIRQDPMGTGSALLQKVFGALK